MKLKTFQTIFVFILVLFLYISAYAQAERDKGIEFYRQGNYREAIGSLKKATKNSPFDTQGWTYLGLSYLKNEDIKNAIKTLRKVVEIDPKNTDARLGLAYANLLKNNLEDAQREAGILLELNPKSAEANYIIGVVNFRNGSYNSAYQRALKSIELNSGFTTAYLLRAEALISSFVQQTGTVMKPANARSEILKEASESLEKYLSQMPADKQTKFYQQYLESVKFFAQFYNLPENQMPKISDAEAPTNDNTTQIKILTKPRPAYTDAARQSGIQGVIRLLVGFSSDGVIKHVMVLKPLSHGLNEQAVRAVREIKFEPATKYGKPVSVVKQIEYSFSIY